MASERALVTGSEVRERLDSRPTDGTLCPLLTIEQVAGVLGVSPKTVRRLRVPCVRVGRSVRYSRQALTKWLQAREE